MAWIHTLNLRFRPLGLKRAYIEPVCEGTREGKDVLLWARRVGVVLQHVEGRLIGT